MAAGRLNAPISCGSGQDGVKPFSLFQCIGLGESRVRVLQTQSAFHPVARFCAAITRSTSPRTLDRPFRFSKRNQLVIGTHTRNAFRRDAHNNPNPSRPARPTLTSRPQLQPALLKLLAIFPNTSSARVT